MIEILQIFLHFFLFIFLTYFPVNKFTLPKIVSTYQISNFFCFFINIVILLNIFLLFSFFQLNLQYVLFLIFFLYLILFFFYFLNIKNEILSKKNLVLKIFFSLLNIFFYFNIAANPALGWDGLTIWLHKANMFYNNNSYFEIGSNYPQLGSYIWAFFWKNSFIQKEYLGRMFIIYTYLVSIFLIVGLFKRFSAYKKILLIFFLIFFSYDKDLQGYQEYLIFTLLLFCSKILFLLNVNKKISNNSFYYLILIMTVILLPWIKNEGIFYSIFISIIFITFDFINLKKKIIFFFIILINIVTQIIFIKLYFQSDQIFQVPLIQESLFKNFFNFKDFLSRLFIISYYIFHSLVKYPLILINLISILIIYIYRKHLAVPNFFIIFFFLNLIFIYSIYMVTTQPLIWHLQTSIKRLMLQTSGFYIILLSVFANKNSFKLIS
jgi:hypothetical protein